MAGSSPSDSLRAGTSPVSSNMAGKFQSWTGWPTAMFDYQGLVGGIPTPLKNMSSSVGIMKFLIYGKTKMFQTTNQMFCYVLFHKFEYGMGPTITCQCRKNICQYWSKWSWGDGSHYDHASMSHVSKKRLSQFPRRNTLASTTFLVGLSHQTPSQQLYHHSTVGDLEAQPLLETPNLLVQSCGTVNERPPKWRILLEQDCFVGFAWTNTLPGLGRCTSSKMLPLPCHTTIVVTDSETYANCFFEPAGYEIRAYSIKPVENIYMTLKSCLLTERPLNRRRGGYPEGGIQTHPWTPNS